MFRARAGAVSVREGQGADPMKKSKGQKPLAPSGSLGIEAAAPLAAELQEAFASDGFAELDLSRVEDIELPALQVLYAARRHADAAGHVFRLSGTVGEPLSLRLVHAGFIRAACATGEELESALVDYRKEEA